MINSLIAVVRLITAILVPRKKKLFILFIFATVSILLRIDVVVGSYFMLQNADVHGAKAVLDVEAGIHSPLKTVVTNTSHIERNVEPYHKLNDSTRNYTSLTSKQPNDDDIDDDELVRMYTETLSYPWKHNDTNTIRIRKELLANSTTRKPLILTKQNVHLKEPLSYAYIPDRGPKSPVSRDLYSILPNTSTIGNKRYKTCSVVGNGGILTGSGCGHVIDSSEYVFRCNAAPLKRFSKDSGRKSNLTTFNRSIIDFRYGGLRKQGNRTKLRQDMSEHSMVWLPMFTHTGNTHAYIALAKSLRQYNVQVVVMYPGHMIQTQKHWNTLGLEKLLSTGLYMTSVAIELCDEVQLFGFWPFGTSPHRGALPYHYYDNVENPKIHNFSQEFAMLVKLHELGIIKINVDCV